MKVIDKAAAKYDKKTKASPRTKASHQKQAARVQKAKTPSQNKRAIMKNREEEEINAKREAKKNGGVKNVKRTKYGVQYNYKNGTGYWIEK